MGPGLAAAGAPGRRRRRHPRALRHRLRAAHRPRLRLTRGGRPTPAHAPPRWLWTAQAGAGAPAPASPGAHPARPLPEAAPGRPAGRLAHGVGAALAAARGGSTRPGPPARGARASGEWLGEVDLAWPDQRVLVEFDGEVHRDRRVFVRDLRRQNRLVLAGWTTLRFSSADVLGRPREVVAAIRAALGR
ncbi:endonuclease domain-containing protein [Blastococcus sp. TF02A-26]|uniref:endonuclease domain-containing protein n=1 Tax=Blastococcus sp. TF02A-26 TaxID=2250577 RepID=UPI000DEA88B8|nr:DUF559 domain-containing protein [Blastococcus sp. TF02A-26]RBY82635.1 hypothetical protein DQ240_18175 [Blastococcus sp. TF02A-26]